LPGNAVIILLLPRWVMIVTVFKLVL